MSSKQFVWDSGFVALGYLLPHQLDLYETLITKREPFIECARRFGKTTTILCRVIEMLRRNPGWVCRWCEPWKNQCREIVVPEVNKILSFYGATDAIRYQTTDSCYTFPNRSILYLRGVCEDRGDSARGPTANIIVADEFGTWKDPDYIVNEALRPQLQTTRGQFIFASTPPEDLGHKYYEWKDRAIKEDRFIQKIITDNTSLSKERISELCTEVGGAQTAAWRREYLCEPVATIERLVIPEFEEALHSVEIQTPPNFYDTYVGMDLGFNDNTAAIFGYYDFQRRELNIVDEILMNGKNSRYIVEQCRAKERQYWGDAKPYRRIADNDLQQLYDMQSLFNYAVSPTRKDDKLAAINNLRVMFTQGRIKINKRCRSLIYQLKVGMWNERRTDFVRGERTGHLDALDALIYLSRNLDEHHNPVPKHHGIDKFTQLVNESVYKTEENQALKEVFAPFGE